MSTTTTEEQQQPTYQSIQRLSNIPLVSDSLQTIHTRLSSSPYTQTAYSTAQSITTSAYRASAPLTLRLAPVLTRADNYATKGLDVVEGRFPYAFHTSPETMIGDLKSQTESATATAAKTFDEKVRSPAIGLVQSVDQRLAPLVNQYEALVNKVAPTESSGSSSSSESLSSPTSSTASTSQVRRAYRLSIDLKDQIFILSSEQIKQLQSHNVLLQRATEAVNSLNAALSNTYTSAKGKTVALGKDATAKVQTLSQNMLSELEKYQSATAQLPANVQKTMKPITDALRSTANDLRAIAASQELSLTDKATRIGTTVRERLQPALSQANAQLQSFFNGVLHREPSKEEPRTYAGAVNGSTSGQ